MQLHLCMSFSCIWEWNMLSVMLFHFFHHIFVDGWLQHFIHFMHFWNERCHVDIVVKCLPTVFQQNKRLRDSFFQGKNLGYKYCNFAIGKSFKKRKIKLLLLLLLMKTIMLEESQVISYFIQKKIFFQILCHILCCG